LAVQLQHDIEKDEAKFEFKPQKDDVYAVASLLKVRNTITLSIRDADCPRSCICVSFRNPSSNILCRTVYNIQKTEVDLPHISYHDIS
jgi:hypothetical protein